MVVSDKSLSILQPYLYLKSSSRSYRHLRGGWCPQFPLKAISTINMIEAYSDLHALRFILHIFFFCIFNSNHVPADLRKLRLYYPSTALSYPRHSSSLSQAQLFLIPDTALSYPGHSSFLSRTALSYLTHSSFISCAQDMQELCLGLERAVFRIRKSCARDKRELCLG